MACGCSIPPRVGAPAKGGGCVPLAPHAHRVPRAPHALRVPSAPHVQLVAYATEVVARATSPWTPGLESWHSGHACTVYRACLSLMHRDVVKRWANARTARHSTLEARRSARLGLCPGLRTRGRGASACKGSLCTHHAHSTVAIARVLDVPGCSTRGAPRRRRLLEERPHAVMPGLTYR